MLFRSKLTLQESHGTVPAGRLLRVDGEGPTRLAHLTEVEADLGICFLLEWSKSVVAFAALEHDVLQLWEDAGATSDDTRNADEAVQVSLTELAEGVVDWEIGRASCRERV